MAVMSEQQKREFKANTLAITQNFESILNISDLMSGDEVKQELDIIRNLVNMNEKLALGQEVE